MLLAHHTMLSLSLHYHNCSALPLVSPLIFCSSVDNLQRSKDLTSLPLGLEELQFWSPGFFSDPKESFIENDPFASSSVVVPNLGPPGALGLQFPEAFTSAGQDFWELKSKNIWRPKVGDH